MKAIKTKIDPRTLVVRSNQTRNAKIISLPNLDTKILNVDGDLGVDNIKAAFKTVLVLGGQIVALGKDFSIAGAFPLVLELAKYETYLGTFKKALAEFRDKISPEEAHEIADALKIDFDIENNRLEVVIEHFIDLLPRSYQFIKDGIDLGLQWKDAIEEVKVIFQEKDNALPLTKTALK